MNEYEPTIPDETPPDGPVSGVTTPPSFAGSSGDTAAPAPPPPASSPDRSAPMAKELRRPGIRRLLWNRRSGRIMAAVVMFSVTGLSVGLATASPASAASSSAPAGHFGSGGGGSNARSGPAAGGSSGTVGTVSNSSFTLTTSAGQKVTVDEEFSTKYLKGTSSSSASAIKKGETVLVLGTVSSTTIKATQVTVQTTGGGSATSSAAQVVPFQRGAPSTSKQVGQIPANYTEGSGTIVSGTTANKATKAALAAYPGGVVDRVVKLSNGEYEVHYIGVNWPHHIFVNQDFKVVGAD
jgi:hypothetical protein